jgi:hypothetical protein
MRPLRAAVSCRACARTWHSQAMTDGLRLLDACPRCGGQLAFHGDASGGLPGEPMDISARRLGILEPHLVLGLPRR